MAVCEYTSELFLFYDTIILRQLIYEMNQYLLLKYFFLDNKLNVLLTKFLIFPIKRNLMSLQQNLNLVRKFMWLTSLYVSFGEKSVILMKNMKT
uniref:Uncharacterized protein n=1 Tax=Heterorhabditis bacteriophora TaxID=37862 RepID=A0A1I7WIE4_HETBA